jgi:hypothetical protein
VNCALYSSTVVRVCVAAGLLHIGGYALLGGGCGSRIRSTSTNKSAKDQIECCFFTAIQETIIYSRIKFATFDFVWCLVCFAKHMTISIRENRIQGSVCSDQLSNGAVTWLHLRAGRDHGARSRSTRGYRRSGGRRVCGLTRERATSAIVHTQRLAHHSQVLWTGVVWAIVRHTEGHTEPKVASLDIVAFAN